MGNEPTGGAISTSRFLSCYNRVMIYLVLAIIFAFAVVAFALGNNDAVPVKFLFWQFESSLALLLLTVFTLGVLTALLTVLPSWFRKSLMVRRLKGEIKNNQSESIDTVMLNQSSSNEDKKMHF
jgi:uncharacterized integral membrane protein